MKGGLRLTLSRLQHKDGETYNVLSLIEQLEDIPEVEQIFMTGIFRRLCQLVLAPKGSMVQLADVGKEQSTDKIVEDARERLKDIPDADIKVGSQGIMSFAMAGLQIYLLKLKGMTLTGLKRFPILLQKKYQS